LEFRRVLFRSVRTQRAVTDRQLKSVVRVKKPLNALLALTEVRHAREQLAHLRGQTVPANEVVRRQVKVWQRPASVTRLLHVAAHVIVEARSVCRAYHLHLPLGRSQFDNSFRSFINGCSTPTP